MTTTPPADPFGIHHTVDQLDGVHPAEPDQIRHAGNQRVRNRRVATVAGLAVCAILAGVGIANLGQLGSNSKPDVAVPPTTTPVVTSAPTSPTPTPMPSLTPSPSTPGSTPSSSPSDSPVAGPSTAATGGTSAKPPTAGNISDDNFPTTDELYFADPGDSKLIIVPDNEAEQTYLNCLMFGTMFGSEGPELIDGKLGIYQGVPVDDASYVVNIEQYGDSKDAVWAADIARLLLTSCMDTPEGKAAKMQLITQGAVPVSVPGATAYQVGFKDEVNPDGTSVFAEAMIVTSGNRLMVAFHIGSGEDFNCAPVANGDEGQCQLAAKANVLATALQR